MKHAFTLFIALLLAPVAALHADSALVERQWNVDGVARTALVHIPPAATKAATPVVFVFHGHNGNARAISRKLAIHELWPDAIVVYPQGLPSPGRFDPEGKTPGWQKSRGNQGDRDLKFFDEILATLKREDKLDEKRIYATGHSNGGAFTYLLSAERGTVLAAVAVCSSVTHQKEDLSAKPVLHIAGEQDPNIRFAQQQRTMEAIRKVNGCDAASQPWTKAEGFTTTLYPSKTGTTLVTAIYPGGHAVPEGAAALIVKFFQEQGKGPAADTAPVTPKQGQAFPPPDVNAKPSPAPAVPPNSASRAFTGLRFSNDYNAGTKDARGQPMSGTETTRLPAANYCTLFQKRCVVGETIIVGKWAVPVFFP